MDFNNDNILSINKQDVNVMILVESHYNTLMALQKYRKEELENTTPITNNILGSRIEGLFYFLRPSLKRYAKANYDKVKDQALSKDLSIKLQGLESMQDFLFLKGILQYGKEKTVDTSDVLDEDESKGL